MKVEQEGAGHGSRHWSARVRRGRVSAPSQDNLYSVRRRRHSRHPAARRGAARIDHKVGSLIHRALMRSQWAGELDTHSLGTGAIDFEQWSRPECASGPLQCASAHRSHFSRGARRVSHSPTEDRAGRELPARLALEEPRRAPRAQLLSQHYRSSNEMSDITPLQTRDKSYAGAVPGGAAVRGAGGVALYTLGIYTIVRSKCAGGERGKG